MWPVPKSNIREVAGNLFWIQSEVRFVTAGGASRIKCIRLPLIIIVSGA